MTSADDDRLVVIHRDEALREYTDELHEWERRKAEQVQRRLESERRARAAGHPSASTFDALPPWLTTDGPYEFDPADGWRLRAEVDPVSGEQVPASSPTAIAPSVAVGLARYFGGVINAARDVARQVTG